MFYAALAILLSVVFGPPAIGVAEAVFSICSLLTLAGLVLFRRKTRAWKIDYDATNYRHEKAERKLHPVRAKLKRVFFRTAIWLPSAIAALVVFCFPIASHLACPNSHYLRHFRVPIPWTATVLPQYQRGSDLVEALVNSSGKGRFAVTTFWDPEPTLLSLMRFWERTDVDRSTYDYAGLAVRDAATQVLRRDFEVGDLVLSCWQYVPRRNMFRMGVGTMWRIGCQTPAPARQPGFNASFYGSERGIPAFYRVIQGVTPLE